MGIKDASEPDYIEPIELYKKSIAERTVLPSTPPAVTMTLEKRLSISSSHISHVWTVHVRENPSHNEKATKYPPLLVAKIFDPLFFGGKGADAFDAFLVRDINLYTEVKAYEDLKHFQGTVIPQFYGLFVAALPAQRNRPVYILLLEEVPGKDLYRNLPPHVAERVCLKHKEAILEGALNLLFDFCECGVNPMEDMRPRNIILRPQKRVVSEAQFCTTDSCPATRKIDCDDLHLVMVDFESVEFMDEQDRTWNRAHRQEQVEDLKSRLLEEEWLEGKY